MEWLDVLNRIERGEDRHTEFKRGLGDLSAVGKAICAFANTEGGVVILGRTNGELHAQSGVHGTARQGLARDATSDS